ncbi:zinc metallopeptidase [Blattabacterium cuenoti]|uniref:zinc metallopeptidase n=1 Tax=Blattabacterium cuenoti TaxID=1653831 RepID=UPI00163C9C60|nr:zinc metallopeptidase [Blattabacterium cuenoti]
MNYYLIVGVIFLISIVINMILKKKLRKYSKVKLKLNINGEEIAKKMLEDHGIYNLNIITTKGDPCNNYYDPINRTIHLSEEVFYQTNITSVSIATHESAHAIQHQYGYNLLKLRNNMVPILNFSSKWTNILIMLGITLFYISGGRSTIVLQLGIFGFFLMFLFSLITLPVEFDASKRALDWVKKNNHIVKYNDISKIECGLRWASLTYVISTIGYLSQLMYFISIFKNTLDTNEYGRDD